MPLKHLGSRNIKDSGAGAGVLEYSRVTATQANLAGVRKVGGRRVLASENATRCGSLYRSLASLALRFHWLHCLIINNRFFGLHKASRVSGAQDGAESTTNEGNTEN